jgi:two-component system cell cycle response regulator
MKNILIIDDEPVIRELLKTILEKSGYSVKTAVNGQDGIKIIEQDELDLILLDLNLPDSKGLDTVRKFTELVATKTPITVLTAVNDDELGMQAIQLGAEDYLVKGQYDTRLMMRSIKYSIERNRLKKELLQMSTSDELTGLCNRRGFKMLVEQKIKEAKRSKKAIVLFVIDLNLLKKVNDQYGHAMGDTALKDTAALLKKTFRESDIISRWGGDEYVVLGVDTSVEFVPRIKERLSLNVDQYNLTSGRPFKLSMSVGEVIKYCDSPNALDEVLAEADKKMYEQKKNR